MEENEFEEEPEMQLEINDDALQAARNEEIAFKKDLGVWELASYDWKGPSGYQMGGCGQGPRWRAGYQEPIGGTRFQSPGV